MSLLEQDTTRKGRVNKNEVTKLDTSKNESSEYKMKAVLDNAIYKKKVASHLLRLYYLVF